MTHPLADHAVQDVHPSNDSAKRRAVWSEFVPFETLRRRRVLSVLAKRCLGLYVAVTPTEVGGIAAVVREAKAHGVWIGVWPMLSDDEGRWAAGRNRVPFMKHAVRVVAALVSGDAVPDGFALDLEPPIGELRRLLRGDFRAWLHWMGRPRTAAGGYGDLLRSVEEAGIETLATMVPAIAIDGRGRGFERVLDAPLSQLEAGRVCPMAYSSLFEGYSAGRLGRADALALVGLTARATQRRYGAKASLALGIVGRGAIGDEASYRSVGELEADVAASRAAGVDDLVLHDLAGVLARPPAEAWLDAFVDAKPRSAPLTPKARVVAVSAWALSRLLGVPGRRLRPPT